MVTGLRPSTCLITGSWPTRPSSCTRFIAGERARRSSQLLICWMDESLYETQTFTHISPRSGWCLCSCTLPAASTAGDRQKVRKSLRISYIGQKVKINYLLTVYLSGSLFSWVNIFLILSHHLFFTCAEVLLNIFSALRGKRGQTDRKTAAQTGLTNGENRELFITEKNGRKKHPIHIVTISIYSSHNLNLNVLYNKKFKENM